jgi:hypothetical protein
MESHGTHEHGDEVMKRTLALGSIALLAYRFFKGRKAEEAASTTRSRRTSRSRSGARSRAKSR